MRVHLPSSSGFAISSLKSPISILSPSAAFEELGIPAAKLMKAAANNTLVEFIDLIYNQEI